MTSKRLTGEETRLTNCRWTDCFTTQSEPAAKTSRAVRSRAPASASSRVEGIVQIEQQVDRDLPEDQRIGMK